MHTELLNATLGSITQEKVDRYPERYQWGEN